MSSNKNQKNERRKYLENPNTDFFFVSTPKYDCVASLLSLSWSFFPSVSYLALPLSTTRLNQSSISQSDICQWSSRGTQKEALAGVVVNLQKWSLSILFLLYAQTTLSFRGRSHFSVAWDFGWPLTAWTIEYRERMF